MPDEFLRGRSCANSSSSASRGGSPLDELISVALFDAGPTRSAPPAGFHLALLIVLSQRCTERGRHVPLGRLQEHPRRINERLDADAVQSLLSLRNAREVDEATLANGAICCPQGIAAIARPGWSGFASLAHIDRRHARASLPWAATFRDVVAGPRSRSRSNPRACCRRASIAAAADAGAHRCRLPQEAATIGRLLARSVRM